MKKRLTDASAMNCDRYVIVNGKINLIKVNLENMMSKVLRR